MTDSTIESVVGDGPHYEPFGWHQWPEYPWMSYQFRRALGETQEGGGSVSEALCRRVSWASQTGESTR